MQHLCSLQHVLQHPRYGNQPNVQLRMNKSNCDVFAYGILCSGKKRWNPAICNSMEGTRGCLWSQSKERGQIKNKFSHMWDINTQHKEEMKGQRQQNWRMGKQRLLEHWYRHYGERFIQLPDCDHPVLPTGHLIIIQCAHLFYFYL